MNTAALSANAGGHIVIVGAGQAGATAAATFRQRGHHGPITLVGDETVAPYQRPPLSKAYLKSDMALERILLRPESFWAAQNIRLLLGTVVTAIDTVNRTVKLGDGILSYDTLVLATGVSPRALPELPSAAENVVRLHSYRDSDRLRKFLKSDNRLLVIGGGYVGLEVAASARHFGVEVTVLEREARILARVASEALSRSIARIHATHGVDVCCNALIKNFLIESNRVSGVLLEDGTVINCDTLLVGIGSVANDQLARESGIRCSAAGIEVDANCRTSEPHVFAIGDVTCRPVAGFPGALLRLESIQSANEQVRMMVEAVMGQAQPEPEIPWFWSDQYDTKIQIAGLVRPGDTLVTRGNDADRNISFFHLRDGAVAAVEAVNSPADFMAAKHLIKSKRTMDVDALADTNTPIKTLVSG